MIKFSKSKRKIQMLLLAPFMSLYLSNAHAYFFSCGHEDESEVEMSASRAYASSSPHTQREISEEDTDINDSNTFLSILPNSGLCCQLYFLIYQMHRKNFPW